MKHPQHNQWQSQLQAGVAHIAQHDPLLAAVITTAPLPHLVPHTQYYRELVESIISQQLSVKAAATILKRFKNLFPLATPDHFPQPREILEKDSETLRSVGLSRQKAAYIHDLAEKVEDGTVTFDHLDSLSNDEVVAELTKIKGVGVWTVHMFLIFCMGRLDVFPVGDLGIKNGIQKLYALADKPTVEVMEATATRYQWHPYESIASWYIWHSLDNKPQL